jgi:hypothetical protein
MPQVSGSCKPQTIRIDGLNAIGETRQKQIRSWRLLARLNGMPFVHMAAYR